jgi:hypothetical protein
VTGFVPKVVVLVLLLAQAWFGCMHGQMLCVPIAGCTTEAEPCIEDEHDHAGCDGHHHDHDHGPFVPADPDHDHEDCGCHVHLFEPHPEEMTAPVLTASPTDWALIPPSRPALACETTDVESVAISAPPRPPNEACRAQVRGLRSTRLLI